MFHERTVVIESIFQGSSLPDSKSKEARRSLGIASVLGVTFGLDFFSGD
jgi:hypothetical protein